MTETRFRFGGVKPIPPAAHMNKCLYCHLVAICLHCIALEKMYPLLFKHIAVIRSTTSRVVFEFINTDNCPVMKNILVLLNKIEGMRQYQKYPANRPQLQNNTI